MLRNIFDIYQNSAKSKNLWKVINLTLLILSFILVYLYSNTITAQVPKKNQAIPKTTGIQPVILGMTIKALEGQVKKLDSTFAGFNTQPENHYFIKMKALKGKKIDSPVAVLVDDRLYFRKMIDFRLVKNPSGKKKSLEYYSPSEIAFSTEKIHEKMKEIHLKFYDRQLYECQFGLELSVNEMNDLIELYHKKWGEKSYYDSVSETYLWKSADYLVSVTIRGNVFPRIISLRFTHLKKKEAMNKDIEQVKQLLNKILDNKKNQGINKL